MIVDQPVVDLIGEMTVDQGTDASPVALAEHGHQWWIEKRDALPFATRSCTRARRSRVRTIVKAMRTPKRKAAMLASATSTLTSPLFEPTKNEARPTITPERSASPTAFSPRETDVNTDRGRIPGVHYAASAAIDRSDVHIKSCATQP